MVGYKLLGLVAVRTTRCGFFFFFFLWDILFDCIVYIILMRCILK